MKPVVLSVPTLASPQLDGVVPVARKDLGRLPQPAEATIASPKKLGEPGPIPNIPSVDEAGGPAGSVRPGEWFGRYRIEQLLGRGGMGEVYRALDTRLHRVVALKVVRRDAGLSPDAAESMFREARAVVTVRS